MVEEWMNNYENDAVYNIAETCVDSVSIDELFEITGENKQAFFDCFCDRRMTYGAIWGAKEFKDGICSLYKTIEPKDVVSTHGASGANHLAFYSLVEPGDEVISIMPTYQQLYSIPESFGAVVKIMNLKKDNGYLVDVDELKSLISPKTKIICINNPNNPTGALMPKTELEEIAAAAKTVGAYVLCDEVYRWLGQTDEYPESIADLYEKGISISSMSKVFSLAGLRLGWIASRDRAFMESCLIHRDYNTVSCGLFDEAIAAIALKHKDKLLLRNKAFVRRNLAVLDAWVQTQPHITYVKPKAGTTALLFYDFDMPSDEFCRLLLKETGAFLTPGVCFEQGNSLRIGYACETEDLKNGLKKLAMFIKQNAYTRNGGR